MQERATASARHEASRAPLEADSSAPLDELPPLLSARRLQRGEPRVGPRRVERGRGLSPHSLSRSLLPLYLCSRASYRRWGKRTSAQPLSFSPFTAINHPGDNCRERARYNETCAPVCMCARAHWFDDPFLARVSKVELTTLFYERRKFFDFFFFFYRFVWFFVVG